MVFTLDTVSEVISEFETSELFVLSGVELSGVPPIIKLSSTTPIISQNHQRLKIDFF